MGTYFSTPKYVSTKVILINQASCHQCNSIVKSNAICKCGNVEVYGGTEELGRKVKNVSLYSDCNLFEYRRK